MRLRCISLIGLLWRQSTVARTHSVPAFWRDWLLHPGSLTQRLLDASDGQFKVEVLSQSLLRPSLSERRALSLPEHRLALVREVILSGRGVALGICSQCYSPADPDWSFAQIAPSR